MEYTLSPYECSFTVEDRKALIAHSMTEVRKGSGLSQKEVAAMLGVSQSAYSAWERGRNEPPAEILVRLSYLFKIPVDVLVQRDRLHKTADEAQRQIDDLKGQLKELEDQITANGGDNPVARDFLKAMGLLTEQMELLNKTPAAAKQYEGLFQK